MRVFVIFLLTFLSISIIIPSLAQEEYAGTQKFLRGVGAEYDEENKGFDIEYALEGELHNFILVDSESNSITFEYDSKGIKEDVLIIYLPVKLIEEPIAVFVNGDKEPNAIRSQVGDIVRMIIPLYEDSKTITIKGTKVISKNSIDSETSDTKDSHGGGCLIATATYGSELAPQVQQLRELRDTKLLQTKSGSFFMASFNDFYYFFSPKIADFERQNPLFKEIIKLSIMPMVSSLSILNHVNMNTENEVLSYGISVIVLNIGMYFGIPVGIVFVIQKKLLKFFSI